MSTALDGFFIANQAPGNSATFKLKGGTYGLSATATGTGTFGLQRLANDGATWVPVHTAFTTGANYLAVTIPDGSYRVASATVTALFFEVAGIFASP
jgi:hypothetical protein